MNGVVLAGLALLLILTGCDRSTPPPARDPVGAAPSTEYATAAPAPTGGSPEPPARLPPARTCRDASEKADLDRLPGQVNGALVRGGGGLRRLRERWGDALVIVRNGNFAGADLRRARLHNICFVGADFSGSDWRGAMAPGIGFQGADLTRAKLGRSSMKEIYFGGALLDGVDASGADWSGGRVAGSIEGRDGLRVDGAKLRGFHFDCSEHAVASCAEERGKVSFRKADLTDAWVDGFRGEADWTGARFDRTRVDLRQLLEIGAARLGGPLIVYEDRRSALLRPSEYAAIRPYLRAPSDEPAPIRAGRRSPELRPGALTVYAAGPIRVAPAGRSSPVWRRLLPVLAAGASARLVVRARRGGEIDAIGDASGAASHACGLAARRLRFDPRSGWYAGLTRRPPNGGAGWRARRLPVLRFGRGTVEVRDRGHSRDLDYDSFVLCGARAGFFEMERLPLPAAEAMRIMGTRSFDQALAEWGQY